MIEHDEDWIDERVLKIFNPSLHCEGCCSDSAIEDALMDYHEHMQRLRPVADPLPGDGKLLIICCIDKKGEQIVNLRQ